MQIAPIDSIKSVIKDTIYSSLPDNHYIDNQRFSKEIQDYNTKYYLAIESGHNPPKISNYIGECFLKISHGLIKKPIFKNYTWKDDMIADGVESCLRYIKNYNIKTETRTNAPNAFYYFSKIAFYAFVRRIKKEKRQLEIRQSIYDHQEIVKQLVQSDE